MSSLRWSNAPPRPRRGGSDSASNSTSALSLVHVVTTRRAASAAAAQVARLAVRQAEEGIKVGVIAHPAVVETLGSNTTVSTVAASFRSSLDPFALLTVRRAFRQWRPTVVHAHGVLAAAAVRLAAVGKVQVPLVVSRALTFPLHPLSSVLLRSPAVAAILAPCTTVASSILASIRLPASRVRVCRDGSDLPWLEAATARAESLREQLGVASARPLVVHLGVRSWRGGGEMLKAWPAVLRRLPEARLLLAACADKGDQEEVLDLAEEMGLGATVLVSEKGFDTPELLAAADLVADASWAGAGVSMAVRDAMALGRPVVAVARDGNLELVQAGINGLLVPPRDPPTMAAAVIRLATDQPLAGRLSTAGRKAIQQGWLLKAQLAELEEVYRQLPLGAPLTPLVRRAGR